MIISRQTQAGSKRFIRPVVFQDLSSFSMLTPSAPPDSSPCFFTVSCFSHLQKYLNDAFDQYEIIAVYTKGPSTHQRSIVDKYCIIVLRWPKYSVVRAHFARGARTMHTISVRAAWRTSSVNFVRDIRAIFPRQKKKEWFPAPAILCAYFVKRRRCYRRCTRHAKIPSGSSSQCLVA
jgi:hypothetical protein